MADFGLTLGSIFGVMVGMGLMCPSNDRDPGLKQVLTGFLIMMGCICILIMQVGEMINYIRNLW